MTEAEAVKALQSGDVRGLEVLAAIHELRALRTAYAITGNRAMAEDIVADAFLKAFERIAQLELGRPFSPWFFRIVTNGALQTVRRSRWTVTSDQVPVILEQRPDPSPNPEQALQLKEMQAFLLALVRSLGAEERAVLVLRYYLDMDEQTVATTLGWRLGTVKSRLHRARQRLRQRLTDQTRNEWACRPSGGIL